MTTPTEMLVTLPSGGRAWISTVIDHAQSTALYRHWLRLNRYQSRDREGNAVERSDLTSEQMDERDELQLATAEVHIRTITRRWEGVLDPQGEPLTFPDDVARMQQPDFDALFLAVTEFRTRESLPNSIAPSASS